MSRNILFFAIAFIFISCEEGEPTNTLPQQSSELSAEEIIANSVAFHGGGSYDTAEVAFSFRDRTYTGGWNQGAYQFSRNFTQNGEQV
ncbi:MAG: hypothetical protein AAGM67_17335, partial [Bacteroidota bacterium]